jgi:hypothetical protein
MTDLRHAKQIAREDLLPSDSRRQLIEGLPDFIEDAAYDALLPSLMRLLRQKSEV